MDSIYRIIPCDGVHRKEVLHPEFAPHGFQHCARKTFKLFRGCKIILDKFFFHEGALGIIPETNKV
jgi:hypothetical protein